MPRPKGEPGLRPPEAHSALHRVSSSVCLLYECFLTPKSLSSAVHSVCPGCLPYSSAAPCHAQDFSCLQVCGWQLTLPIYIINTWKNHFKEKCGCGRGTTHSNTYFSSSFVLSFFFPYLSLFSFSSSSFLKWRQFHHVVQASPDPRSSSVLGLQGEPPRLACCVLGITLQDAGIFQTHRS